MKSATDKKNRTVIALLLVTIILVLIVLGSALVYFISKSSNNVTDQRPVVGGVGQVINGTISDEEVNKIKEDMQKRVDDSMLSIKINSNPVFNSPTSEGDLKIENPETNKLNVQVEITLEESEEKVYTSPLIKPGQHVLSAKLDEVLDVGEHRASAVFYAYDEDENLVGQVGASINLIIQNQEE